MSIDLHIHSTMSDGTMSPVDLVDLAHKKGLSCIALTDHDTVAGYHGAKERGDAVGLDVIPGVEVSVTFEGLHMHLLGYLFDHEDENLVQCLQKLQGARDQRNSEILQKLQSQGITITGTELKAVSICGQTGRPHIARILMQNGIVRSMDEAFDRYLGRNGSAYCNRFAYDLKTGIEIIHKAGGIAVVAHPYNLIKNDMESGKLLTQLSKIGLDGIEAYYPTHSRKFRKQLIFLADKNGLLVTGGSDYHGTIRRGTTLAGGKGVSVPDELVAIMRRIKQENQSKL